MAFDITSITTTPSSPQAGESTQLNVNTTGSGLETVYWILRPIYENNQKNGGVWGGGRSAAMITCDITIEDA